MNEKDRMALKEANKKGFITEKDFYAERKFQKEQEHFKRLYYARKTKVFEILGAKCAHCGYDDARALQIDHIERNTKKEGTAKVYRNILEGNIEEYQMLCANCNWIKRVENKEVKKGR